jgi:hypothetical protein
MRISFDVLIGLGALGLAAGALIWFAPEDNIENVATAHFLALLPLGIGTLLIVAGLLGRVLWPSF